MSVTYTDIVNARTEAANLRSLIRAELKVKRAEVKNLKAQLVESKADDRAALQARMLADGGQRIGAYVVRTSGKRFTLVPNDPTIPVTKGEATFLAAILSSLHVG